MIGVLVVLVSGLGEPQAVQATLQSCAIEQDRWVCRYQVPDVEIIPFTGTPGAPGPPTELVLSTGSGERPLADPDMATPGRATEGLPPPADPGLLSREESRLVARCADAGWLSLCLPDDRRAARMLKEREAAYQTVRRAVTGLLADNHCGDAVRSALDGGYLGLAREARDFCATPDENAVADRSALPPVP